MRKIVEQDALLMSNRINRLKIEETKAVKKINETRQRSNDIHEIRARNEEKRRETAQVGYECSEFASSYSDS